MYKDVLRTEARPVCSTLCLAVLVLCLPGYICAEEVLDRADNVHDPVELTLESAQQAHDPAEEIERIRGRPQ